MSAYAPLFMVGGFLAFGMIFVLGDEVSQWIARRGGRQQ